MSPETLDALETSPKPDPIIPPRSSLRIRQHPKYRDIHADVINRRLTPLQICQKYNLQTDHGNFAVTAVLRYREYLDHRFAALFAKAADLEKEVLRNEFLDKNREVYGKAAADHDKAMGGKKPSFVAAKMMLDAMGAAAEQIGRAVQVGTQPAVPVSQTTNHTNIQVLAMPKTVPSRALKLIDSKPA